MRFESAIDWRRALVVAATMITLLGPPGLSWQDAEKGEKKESIRGPRSTVTKGEAVSAGDWTGTWYYVSRVFRMAIWIREDDGVPRMRLRYQHDTSRETFTTDWAGLGEYRFRDLPGRFEMTFDQMGRDRMSGSWTWSWGAEGSARKETANFDIWRTGGGRQLVLDTIDRIRYTEANPALQLKLDAPLTFHKASRYEAAWNELPF